MAVYVMSDLHVDWAHFRLMLMRIRFSSRDQLYIIGDAVDRGPHGIRLLHYIQKQQNMTLLLGNHELMLLEGLQACGDALDADWFDPATFAELSQLSPAARGELASSLSALPVFLNISAGGQSYFLVHASPAPPGTEGEQLLEYLLWTRVSPDDRFSRPVIAGHTPTAYYQSKTPLRIWRNGNFTDIDCGTAFRSVLPGGCLACLRLDDGREFYV